MAPTQTTKRNSRRPSARRRHIAKPVLTELPQTGQFRVDQFVPSIIGVGKSTWWKLVAKGRAPRPVKLSSRVTVWKAEDLRAWIANSGSAPSTT